MTTEHQKKQILLMLLSIFFCFATLPASSFRHAQKLTISPIEGGHEVTVREPWANAKEVFYTTLLKAGVKKSPTHRGTIIRIPVQTVVAHSTTTIGLMAALGIEDRIVAVSDGKRINTPSVVKRVKNGQIREVGMKGQLNLEVLLELQPELILTYGIGNPKFDTAHSLDRVKLPYMILASYMEDSALARCEWIKLFGVLFGKESEAETHFTMVEKNYHELCLLAKQLKTAPTVFCNLPFGGIWYMPSGSSWRAKLFKDAGAEYLWANDMNSGSHRLQPEQVFSKALSADIWLSPSHDPQYSLKTLVELDSRYQKFKAVRDQKVLVATKRVNEGGGNDFFEKGIARPDLILKDFVHHFHPESLPNYEPTFYQWMTALP
jgi:iron complex transport system substrate-binding protein